jgi:hypothetical protein
MIKGKGVNKQFTSRTVEQNEVFQGYCLTWKAKQA